MAHIEQQAPAMQTPDPEAFRDQYTVEDDAALQLVCRDADLAQAWVDSHFLTIRWIEADMLYQSPPMLKVWEGTKVPRANISLFTVATIVNSLLGKVRNGLFYEKPPFVLRPKPGMTENTTRAIGAVEETQLDQMNFREAVKRGLFSALLLGTAIWKYGWKSYQKKKKKYVRLNPLQKLVAFGKNLMLRTSDSTKYKVTESWVDCEEPTFEDLDIRDVLVDPSTRRGDIRDASCKYVIHKRTVTFRELLELAPQLGYELPEEEEVRQWFMPPAAAEQIQQDRSLEYLGSSAYLHHAAPRFQKTTDDPFDEPLELLERWDDDKVISVLQRARVIRNCENPFGEKPFYSLNWWDTLDAFWGLGLGVVLGGEQRFQQGLVNATADICSLIVNPTIVRSRGANVTSQNVRQRLGGIFDVDGPVKEAFMYAETPKIPAEIFLAGQQSEARAEAVSGANELLTQGSLPSKGRTSLGRTATGASAMAGAVNERIGGFVEDFVLQVFEPFLWDLHQMNCEFLPEQILQEILNDKLGKDFELDAEKYFNAPIQRFEVMAGSHIAVKQQMTQAVSLMVELFGSPQTMSELSQINGQYVDIEELLHMIADVSGFRNFYDVIKPLTAEMKQRMMAQNPAVLQAQAKAGLAQQQHDNAAELIDQKDINRATVLTLRDAMKQNMQTEAVTGEPGGQGLGEGATE